MSQPNPIGVFSSVEGVHEQFSVTSVAESLKHYEAGKTLYFHIDQNSESLRQWMTIICSEMGIANAAYRVSIFATKKSGGILPHFDAHENFTIQLVGSKKWQYAKNDRITNPTVNHFASETFPADMRSYVHHPLPSQMPLKHQIAHLTPGSILYLPAGFWHATNTTGDESISLNIVFLRVTWADIFLQYVKTMLLEDSRWRERADNLFGNMEGKSIARSHIEKLVSDFAQNIQFSPNVLVPLEDGKSATNIVSQYYLRNLMVSWMVLRDDIEQGFSIIQFQPPMGSPIILKVPEILKKVCEWMGEQIQPFNFQQLASAFPNYSENDLEKGLTHFVNIGFLYRMKCE